MSSKDKMHNIGEINDRGECRRPNTSAVRRYMEMLKNSPPQRLSFIALSVNRPKLSKPRFQSPLQGVKLVCFKALHCNHPIGRCFDKDDPGLYTEIASGYRIYGNHSHSVYRSAWGRWCSGNTSALGARVPGFNFRHGFLCLIVCFVVDMFLHSCPKTCVTQFCNVFFDI